jgi:hypothetical protein
VHQRSFAAEPLTAIAATADGLYCAAGGASGAIHVWEVSSGRLLRSWPGHYKVGRILAAAAVMRTGMLRLVQIGGMEWATVCQLMVSPSTRHSCMRQKRVRPVALGKEGPSLPRDSFLFVLLAEATAACTAAACRHAAVK